MKLRQRVTGLSTAGALLTAGCLVLLNLLANRLYLRLDTSAGKLYSLSPGSKRILKNLNKPVEIRAYFSKELPPQFAASRSYLQDLLQEYRNASRGKVRFRFLDVDKDNSGKQEALKQGIAPIQFNVISRDKYEVREGFMGLVVQHEDKKETIPVIAKTESIEYDLTSRILRLTRESRKTLGMLASHGALSPSGMNPHVREALERNYELRPVDLKELKSGATISADIAALVALGPTEKFSEDQLYALDQFLLSGRPLALGLDGQKADLRGSFLVSSLDAPKEFLEHYGVHLKPGLVLDAQSQKVSISQQRGWFTLTNIVDFPPFVVATDLNREHPATRHLDSLTLPLVNPIEVDKKFSGKVHVLARSSKLSWQRSSWTQGLYSINPLQSFAPEAKDSKGPYTLAVALEGRFESYFSSATNRPLPKGTEPKAFLERSAGDSRMLVIGTSRFAQAELPPEDSGPVFLMNLADWMALDSDLISIRSKGAIFRPLKEVSAPYKVLIRWLNVLFPPLLVALYGIFRLQRRKFLRSARIAEILGAPAAQAA